MTVPAPLDAVSVHPGGISTALDTIHNPFRSISTHPLQRTRINQTRLVQLHAKEAAMTTKLQQALEESDCRVALISRPGSDLSPYRFDGEPPAYTHTGFVVRRQNHWRVYQMLNTHSGAEGHLYWQSLIDFFRDDPHEYRCALLVPSRKLQERIVTFIDTQHPVRLYTPRYSRVAYPFSTRYQNSNQWVIELIGAAQSGHGSRRDIQDYLAKQGLGPTVLRSFGFAAQTVIALVSRNTRFDDHPLGNRLAGRIAFVTETSIRRYLQDTDRVELEDTVRLQPPHDAPVAATEFTKAA